MRHWLFIIALAVVAPVGAAGQTGGAAAPGAISAEQEVRQAEREFIEARRQARRGDPAALNRVLADNFVATSLSGRVMNKAQFVRISRNPNLRFTSFRTDQTNIRVYGESAVSTGRASVTARDEEGDRSFSFRYTAVYAKRGPSWQLVALHLTRIAQP